MKSILVTGINGFVGKHLTRELVARGCTVYGADRAPEAHKEISDLLKGYMVADLVNEEEVAKLPLSTFDGVINLAGLANVGASFDNPELYNYINTAVLSVIGSQYFEAKPDGRIIAISTGAVYDNDQPLPLREDSMLVESGSPYALSKISMEQAAAKLYGVGRQCIIARPFNHFGPGQAPGFLIPDLYQRITEATAKKTTLKVGNLDTKRDYTDVRDVVCAYADLVLAKELFYPIYNICSGISRSGEDVLSALLSETEAGTNLEIETDPALIRPNDPPDLYGDNSRLKAMGWEPQIPFEQSIKDFVSSMG